MDSGLSSCQNKNLALISLDMGPSEYYHWIFPSLLSIDTLKYPLHAMHTYSFTPPHTTQIPLILPDIIQGVEGRRHERNIRWHECTPHPSCTKHCYCFPHLRGCCSAYWWSQAEVFIWALRFHYQFQFPPLSPPAVHGSHVCSLAQLCTHISLCQQVLTLRYPFNQSFFTATILHFSAPYFIL